MSAGTVGQREAVLLFYITQQAFGGRRRRQRARIRAFCSSLRDVLAEQCSDAVIVRSVHIILIRTGYRSYNQSIGTRVLASSSTCHGHFRITRNPYGAENEQEAAHVGYAR